MYDSYDDAVTVCPHCAASFDSTRSSGTCRTCPNCGGTITEHDPAEWTDIARVTNLAEAGFLTDELVGMGVDARIHRLDDFNALNDRWTAIYLIRVPAQAAQAAADQIREYLEDDLRGKQGDEQAFQFSLSSQVMDPLFWRPIALVVLTGVASFALGQRFSAQSVDRRLSPDSLPSAINEIGRPLTTEPADGKPRYRLSFDSRQQVWSLDTDRDNDGLYDVSQQFHASGTAW